MCVSAQASAHAGHGGQVPQDIREPETHVTPTWKLRNGRSHPVCTGIVGSRGV